MFIHDYIMRLIHEMVRTLLKTLFNIDTETLTSEMVEDSQYKRIYEDLTMMIDDGKINYKHLKDFFKIQNGEDRIKVFESEENKEYQYEINRGICFDVVIERIKEIKTAMYRVSDVSCFIKEGA